MNWYIKTITENYVKFEGRARRQEYWMFYLFHIIIIFLLGFLMNIFEDSTTSLILGAFLIVYFIATLLPSLAITVRRLHDTGKSGWYYLFSFIPYIGGLILLIFMVIDGDKGPNQYGPDPKAPEDNEIDDIGRPMLEN